MGLAHMFEALVSEPGKSKLAYFRKHLSVFARLFDSISFRVGGGCKMFKKNHKALLRGATTKRRCMEVLNRG